MAFPLPNLTLSSGPAIAEGAPIYGAPSYAGGGVWNVATSGSRASNSGSATQSAGASDALVQYLPYALAALGLLVVFAVLKK